MEKKSIFTAEIRGIVIIFISFILLLCTMSFSYREPEVNLLGMVGYYLALGFTWALGITSYALIFLIGAFGFQTLLSKKIQSIASKIICAALGIISLSILLNLFSDFGFFNSGFIEKRLFSEIVTQQKLNPEIFVRFYIGGVPTHFLLHGMSALSLINLFSPFGVVAIFTFLLVLSVVLFANIHLITVFNDLKDFSKKALRFINRFINDIKPHNRPNNQHTEIKNEEQSSDQLKKLISQAQLKEDVQDSFEKDFDDEELAKDLHISTHHEKRKNAENIKNMDNRTFSGFFAKYKLPPLSLLTDAKKIDKPTLKKDLESQAKILEDTLLSFGIKGRIGQINCGPTITSFEVHPPTGVKVQKIKVLENDIALNMQSKSIRIIAPIPGKAAVGVEVPSPYPQEVGFKKMLGEYQKYSVKHDIPIMLGQTVSGENVICDLTKMPHCIIAGATGSGKSVCINSIVMSILMTARPDQVKLLLVDPKKVELSSYTNLPHMIAPVITEAHGAYAALNWLVKEMGERYEMLKRLKLRNIKAFNHRRQNLELEAESGMEIPKTLPFIVAIIDEFADLMMASSSDLETPIARIAQMARAVGIHLILATQRPSREVVTGLIKANFPGRISFKVASRVNSQIIMDENGAESLLGNGDMLFLPPGTHTLTRAQGVFVRDEDINRVISHIESQSNANYLIKSFDKISQSEFSLKGSEAEFKDELYNEARKVVQESKSASTTFLQRKLKIGYARAASLMDELEENGVIGSLDGTKKRVLLKND